MNRESVTLEETRVVKHYPSPAAATAALDRAKALRAAGLQTPEATQLTQTALAFPRLLGRSGTALATDLRALLAPLVTLHRTPVAGLAPQDPFRRITPRLHGAPSALRDRIAILSDLPRPAPTATIHGDFHPGQVILGTDGTPWLIDLDDMALATAEADLGNLLGYLLTAPGTRQTPPPDGWRKALLAAWRGTWLDPANLCLQTEIAIIRRALKLAERGDVLPLSRLASGGYRAEISGD